MKDTDMKSEATKELSPMKAIRAKCMDCCCDQRDEVKMCPATTCPLWSFRMGKNPHRRPRQMSEEQKEAARNRLSKARLAKAKAKTPVC